MRRCATLVGLALAALGTGSLAAQSAQRLSIQISALSATVFGDEFEGWGSGIGFEGQLRYTHSAFSIGGGWQQTDHTLDEDEIDLSGYDVSLTLSGPFIEPRYVLPTGSSSMAPYVSGRLSLLRESGSIGDGFDEFTFKATGVTLNAGGGVLIRASDRINIDVGATYGYTSFGEATLEGGGFSETFESSSGSNVILRVGVSIGVGR